MKKNKRFFLFIFSLILFAGISIASYSCKCRACSNQEEAVVPLEVLAKADSFVISKTGKEFFDKYISVDFYQTKHASPYYEMVYKFFMPEKPYVNSLIKFTVDSTGILVQKREIVGIPRCRYYSEECEFSIDEETARKIAKENGLEEGIKEWKAGFLWDVKRERYVWNILSTLHEMSGEDVYKATGKEIIIDPTNGEVLALNDWRVN